MRKLKTKKGITLIALIITIIVMLILVGVSVGVSLNGGLFSTAKEAVATTELEIEKERLLEIVLGAIGTDGKVDSSKLNTVINASDDFEMVDNENEIICKGIKTGNLYKVGTYGNITIKEEIACTTHNYTSQGGEIHACTLCGYEEVHTITNIEEGYEECTGICEICSYSKEHSWSSDGTCSCDVCGYTNDDHEFYSVTDDTHECSICGYTEICSWNSEVGYCFCSSCDNYHDSDVCGNVACSICGGFGWCYPTDEEGNPSCLIPCEYCGEYAIQLHDYSPVSHEMHECSYCGNAFEHELNSRNECIYCGYDSDDY